MAILDFGFWILDCSLAQGFYGGDDHGEDFAGI
jgi:hypothetical protein